MPQVGQTQSHYSSAKVTIPLCPLTQLPLQNVSAYIVSMPTEYLAEELESYFLYIKKHSSDSIRHQLVHVDRSR